MRMLLHRVQRLDALGFYSIFIRAVSLLYDKGLIFVFDFTGVHKRRVNLADICSDIASETGTELVLPLGLAPGSPGPSQLIRLLAPRLTEQPSKHQLQMTADSN